MNRIQGVIKEIISEKNLSIVRVAQKGYLFTSIVIGNPPSLPELKIGGRVYLLFKESEVVLAVGPTDHISLRNQIEGQIRQIESGSLLATITMDSDFGSITSIITRNALEHLGLATGKRVTAMIKTNEMMLSV